MSNNEERALVGFAGGDLADIEDAALVGAASREKAEIQSALTVAMARPRDEAKAYSRIISAMSRPGLAAEVEYRFPRGGATVSGPTVDLAREAARIWGNIRHGIRVVGRTDDEIHVEGWAWDLETNVRVSNEVRFAPLVQRKGGWIKADERDLRELVNKHGAMCVRNALLQLIPRDVVDDALQAARKTLGGEDTVGKLVEAFGRLHVRLEMIEEYLGCPVVDVTPDQVADLRAVYKSIKDGHARRDEFFGAKRAPEESKGRISADALKAKKEEPERATASEEPPPEDDGPTPEEMDEADRKAGLFEEGGEDPG